MIVDDTVLNNSPRWCIWPFCWKKFNGNNILISSHNIRWERDKFRCRKQKKWKKKRLKYKCKRITVSGEWVPLETNIRLRFVTATSDFGVYLHKGRILCTRCVCVQLYGSGRKNEGMVVAGRDSKGIQWSIHTVNLGGGWAEDLARRVWHMCQKQGRKSRQTYTHGFTHPCCYVRKGAFVIALDLGEKGRI